MFTCSVPAVGAMAGSRVQRHEGGVVQGPVGQGRDGWRPGPLFGDKRGDDSTLWGLRGSKCKRKLTLKYPPPTSII